MKCSLNRSVVIAILLLAVSGAAWLIVEYWAWLRTVPDGGESGSATVRNLGLLLAAIVALPLAVWRGFAVDRQASASQRQAETAQRSLLNSRYQNSAEMLGNERLSVRLGGIHALGTLAKEYPENFHILVIRLFCAFVRHPTEDDSLKTVRNRDRIQLREDVRDAIVLIAKRNSIQRQIERRFNFNLDFSRASLPGVDFRDAKLAGAEFFLADLSWASFTDADLSGASLRGARLTGAKLTGTELSGTLFASPFESEEDSYWKSFHGTIEDPDDPDYLDYQDSAKGLVQAQLENAWADPDNPPYLTGIQDADSDLYLESPPAKRESD